MGEKFYDDIYTYEYMNTNAPHLCPKTVRPSAQEENEKKYSLLLCYTV